MKRLFLLTLIISSFQAYGQNKIKDFVEKNTNIIKTIEPDSLNFADLEVFGEAIGDSRIVMLGEQDHGDAPTFLAKTRLIKYLHEKKGFNVLAFEEDYFALNEGWNQLSKVKETINPFLKYNITSLWSGCKQTQDLLYTYIPKTFEAASGLQITGFDVQMYRSFSKYKLKKFVNEFLQSQHIQFTSTAIYDSEFISYVDSALIGNNLIKHQKFGDALEVIMKQLSTIQNNISFEMMLIKNLYVSNNIALQRLSNKIASDDRDKQMADNLKWLIQQKYPNEKIIVWAHSAHIYKSPALVKGNVSIKHSMGDFFVKDSLTKQNTYIIGFNTNQGTAGRTTLAKKFKVQPPVKNSFETWIPDTTRFAFVDFKKFNKGNPNSSTYFYMKGIAHSANSGIWNQVYDGVFYIRDTYPCDKVD